jgi:hypothetical protein
MLLSGFWKTGRYDPRCRGRSNTAIVVSGIHRESKQKVVYRISGRSVPVEIVHVAFRVTVWLSAGEGVENTVH